LAVRIRLKRMGAKKRPFYRIVVANSASPRDGRHIDQLGYYDPLTDPATVKVDQDKAVMWLQRGAQPTETAASLLRKQGVMRRLHEEKTAARAATAEAAPGAGAPAEAAPAAAAEPAPSRSKAARGKAGGSKAGGSTAGGSEE
jgi:small subunit ribosomal protein S16